MALRVTYGIRARWKAQSQLSVSDNGTFSLAITVEALRSEICHSRLFMKGWVNLRLNVRVKDCVSRQHVFIIRQVNEFITTLPLKEVFMHGRKL